jgi:peptidyl-prolyl cis-trans isomerase C
MRKVILLAALPVTLMAMPLFAQVKTGAVVVTVNDQPVYSWEVGLLVPKIRSDMAGQGIQAKPEEIARAAVRRVVEARLLAQEAQRRGLKPDGKRVSAALAEIENQAGGRAGLETALARLGATYDQLQASASETDLVQVFLTTQIEPQVTVTAADVSAFYDANPDMFARPDMVRARHMMIRLTPTSTTEDKKNARARATAARQRVISGEDFATVAREVSEGREASNGGDMGFFARDEMMPELTNIAFALDVGQISEIIETRFGFHILKVEEKRPASKMTLEEAEEPVRQLLIENRTGEKVAELLVQLTKAAAIVQIVQPADDPAS